MRDPEMKHEMIQRLRELKAAATILQESVQDFHDDFAREVRVRGGSWGPSDLLHTIENLRQSRTLLKEFEGEVRRII